MNIAAINTIKYIPFKSLVISPENVRVVSASKSEDAQLLASISSQGVLQNIIVTPSENETGFFEVIAGGRRYGAVKALIECGKIPADFSLPAKIEPREKATEISLSENIKASMHPVDEFRAYKKMADQGKNPKEIAQAFGHSAVQVKKLLKLGSVAPVILDNFRDGKMSIESVMAFTVCDEQEKQLLCWKELSRSNLYPRSIRQFLLNSSVEDKSPIALFVGVSTYKKAGGAVAADLFESKTHLLDSSLLESMAGELLKKEIGKITAEGWSWVDVSIEGISCAYPFKKLAAEHVGVPDEINKEIGAVNAALAELQEKEWDDWTDDDSKAQDQLEELLEGLDSKKDNYLQFTQEQMSYSGCVITFNSQGEIIYMRGLARPEDIKSRENKLKMNGEVSAAGGDLPPAPAPIESQALMSDMSDYYGQAMQAELLKHEDLSFDLLVFSLASRVVSDTPHYTRMLNIQANTTSYSASGATNTPANSELENALSALNTSWLIPDDEGKRLEAFRGISKKDKMKIMTFCVAKTAMAAPAPNSKSGYALIKEQVQFDISKYWTATKENYFSRVSKKALVDIGAELCGAEFRERYSLAKKTEIAEILESALQVSGWVPDIYK
jgi:ParB family transcriptional regulator, chromosome partitioning protein